MGKKISGTTKSGFDFEIDEDIKDDWEMVEILSGTEGSDFYQSVVFGKRLLGDEQYQALKDFLKEKEGMVRTSSMTDAFIEIFTFDNSEEETKNL